jgi:hypothetical protein
MPATFRATRTPEEADMKALTKTLTGAAIAAAVTVSAAAPAQAQYRYRDRDNGIDAGDVIAGVAIIGGIAAIASAIGNSNNRDRYDDRYRDRTYGYGYGDAGSERSAVNACIRQAERGDRYSRGRAEISDVNRTDGYYQMRGVVTRYDDYRRGSDRYDRYDSGRTSFTCTARGNRVYDFRTGNDYSYRY